MRGTLIFLLIILLSGFAKGQNMPSWGWQRYYQGGFAHLTSAVLHANGGVIAVGSKNEIPVPNQPFGFFKLAAVRLSASGDSLYASTLPGISASGSNAIVTGPWHLPSRSSQPVYVVVCPTDTDDIYSPRGENALNYMAYLDTSGYLLDSTPILASWLQRIHISHAIQATKTKLVLLGNSQTNHALHLHFVDAEHGNIFKDVQIPNLNFVTNGFIARAGPDKIHLLGVLGTTIIHAVFDTLGNYLSLNPVFESPNQAFCTLQGPHVELPGGRFCFTALWMGVITSSGYQPPGNALIMADSTGTILWKKTRYMGFGYYRPYISTPLCANTDGGIVYSEIYDYLGPSYTTYVRVNADSSVVSTWTQLYNDISISASQIVRLDSGRGFVVGFGAYTGNQTYGWGYGLINGLGTPYIATALKATAGPRVQAITLSTFPNPTKDILNLDGLGGRGGQATFYDAAGRLVLQMPLADRLDISSLFPGLYSVEARTKDGAVVRVRVVKE